MRVMILFALGLNLIGPGLAYVIPPYEGCSWGIGNSDLLIEPGQIITEAVLTIENVRPDAACLNPALSIHLLNNPQKGFLQVSDKSKSIQPLFESGLTPTLTGRWKLEDYSGPVASDASGRGNHAALLNNPVWIDGQGLSFQGTQYLLVPSGPDLNPSSSMAVSLWFKLRSPTRYAKLLIKPFQLRSDPWELYALDLGWDGLTPRFLLSDGIPNGQYEVASGGDNKIVPDQWVHLVGTYNGRQMRLYVNGQLAAQTDTTLRIGANPMPLCIGGRLGSDTFDGIIRDVRLYSGPVSDQPLQLVQTNSLFEGYGTPLKKIEPTDMRNEGQTLSFSLQQIDNPDSWIHSIYGNSFSLPIPGRAAPLSFSSALLELLDCAGSGSGFGIGLDTDGFLFDRVMLTVTTESCQSVQTPRTQNFLYKNKYAPVIIAVSDKTVEPGQRVSFALSVAELDQNPYTISAKNLPAGAVFTNKVFSWTPAENQTGQWTINFEATDGVMTGQRQVQIQVNPPTPVFVPADNPVVYELQTLTLPIQAVNLAGQPVPVTVSGLPAGASFDGTALLWRPLYGQAGSYPVTFSASNEIRQETRTVTITVLPYRPPAQNKSILIL